MPAKGSSKNPRYRGMDARGHPMFEGECGHIVWGMNAKMCVPCYQKTRAAPNYLGQKDGHNIYLAPCGHEVPNAQTKRCRACTRVVSTRRRSLHVHRHYPVTMVDGKVKRVHVVIAEQTLGRPLRRDEVVHHINMDKFDNRRCNLLICDRAYHQYLHHAMQLAFARRLVPPKE